LKKLLTRLQRCDFGFCKEGIGIDEILERAAGTATTRYAKRSLTALILTVTMTAMGSNRLFPGDGWHRQKGDRILLMASRKELEIGLGVLSPTQKQVEELQR